MKIKVDFMYIFSCIHCIELKKNIEAKYYSIFKQGRKRTQQKGMVFRTLFVLFKIHIAKTKRVLS